MKTTMAFMVAAITVVSACGDGPTELGNGPGERPAEDLGVPATATGVAAEQSWLAWSPDGHEVFFLGTGPTPDLMAVRVADGAMRTVTSGPTRTDRFYVSLDGQWVYRTRNASHPPVDSHVFDRIPTAGGPAETIAENVTGFLFTAWVDPPVAPDGNLLAYAARGEKGDPDDARIGTRDTLYLYDLASKERTAIGFGVPLAFSPDGSQLAYDERPCDESGLWTNPCDTYVVDLGTDMRRHVPWDKDDNGKQPWWDEGGLKSFASTHDFDTADSPLQWIVRNLSLETVTIAYSLTLTKEMPHPGGMAHCQAGTRVGGWITDLEGEFSGIRVFDLQAERDHLAVVNRTGEGWSLAFSWDGRRIAYLIDRGVFVQELPASF